MIHNYVETIENLDEECKSFILRQINRMPSHYYLALALICTIFYVFRLQPSKVYLMDKFFSSLLTVKLYEN